MSRTFCPDGVHFDGSTWLECASLAATDNTVASASFWFRVGATISFGDDYPIFFGDAPGGFNSVVVSNFPPVGNTVVGSFGGPGGPDKYVSVNNAPTTDPTNTQPPSWYHGLISGDISGAGVIKLYIGGVDSGIQYGNSGSGGTLSWNGKNLFIGYGNSGGPAVNKLTGDLAEVWIAPGQSLLNGSGIIPPATIAKFYANGCPVDLGSDGSTPTGTAPAVYLSRPHGAAASMFATNRGTGGTFATTGTLTAAVSPACACSTGRQSHVMVGLIPGTVGL